MEEKKPQTQKPVENQTPVGGDEKQPKQELPNKLERATRHYERQGFDPDWGQH